MCSCVNFLVSRLFLIFIKLIACVMGEYSAMGDR